MSNHPTRTILALLTFALLVTVNLTSCRTLAPVPTIVQHDTVMMINQKFDSIYQYERDSMAISLRSGAHVGSDPTCYPCGRTIGGQTLMSYPARVDTMVIERWHTRFKDHETVKTDTLKVTEYQTITETQKYIPRFYRICTWICCVGVVLLVLLLVLKFTLKFI